MSTELEREAVSNGPGPLLRACRGERSERVPVWIMRQAGRYLPEYRELRERVDFLTATRTPELAAEITLQPMRRFPLDAAILFSDIMTPLQGMGVEVEFSPGPVIADPVRSAARVRELRSLDPVADTGFVLEAIRIVRAELEPQRGLVGFAGAPFTLFCYLVEGSGSKDFMAARAFLRAEPAAAQELLGLLGRSMAAYLNAQARAGADVLMLFDSWVGLLGPETYRRAVLPVLIETLREIRAATDRPIVYYANRAATLLEEMRELGADVLGLDWTVPLSGAVARLGPEVVLQGNLDPSWLFASEAELGPAVDAVLEQGSGAAAHIFNLGHGIHRDTDPQRVAYLVERVHRTSAAGRVGGRAV